MMRYINRLTEKELKWLCQKLGLVYFFEDEGKDFYNYNADGIECYSCQFEAFTGDVLKDNSVFLTDYGVKWTDFYNLEPQFVDNMQRVFLVNMKVLMTKKKRWEAYKKHYTAYYDEIYDKKVKLAKKQLSEAHKVRKDATDLLDV